MPAQLPARLREPNHMQDVAASVCFQSAGQVVTVLGKIDRHFDDAAIAGFAKHAVAEYAAKQQAQLVAVTIMQDAGKDSPDDAQHFTHDGQDYAITIGNLADERTRMDHLTRVMERLKYLQAVMVMLSTTDMLGTSQALGKHMGGMTARLQQVQKIGLQLEKLTSKIEEAKKRNQPLSQKVFERQLTTLLTQMQKLQTGAPPELRRVLQTMIAQVKELRQLPMLTNQVRAVVTPLKVVAKNDVAQKIEHRFKAQPAKLSLRVVEGGRTAQQQSQRVVMPSRVMPNTFRIPVTSLAKIAAQIKPANDNRFRVTQAIVARISPNAVKQVSAPAQIMKSNVVLPVQRRFTAISAISKLPAVLMAAVGTMNANIPPVGRPTIQAQAQPRGISPQIVSPLRTTMLQSGVVESGALQSSIAQTITPQAAHVATPIIAAVSVPQVGQTISPSIVQANIAQVEAKPMASMTVAQQAHIQQPISVPAPIAVEAPRSNPSNVPVQSTVNASTVHVIKGPEGVQPSANGFHAAVPKTQTVSANGDVPRANEGVVNAAAQQSRVTGGSEISDNAGTAGHSVQPSNPLTPPVPMPPIGQPIVITPSLPATPPPAQQQAAVTSVPTVPQAVGNANPYSQPQAEAAKQPIIQQYKQAAQDLGERVVRGAQEFRIQTQDNVRRAASYIGSIVERGQQFVATNSQGADALLSTLSDKTKSIMRVFKTAKGIICCKTGGDICNCTREPSKMEIKVVNNANLALA